MKEYEYSFKVKSIEPYINYCKNNNYNLIDIIKENRRVYENKHNNKLIARITSRIKNNKKDMKLDFKNVSSNNDDLKISLESIPIKITKRNKKQIDSILKVLDFYEVTNNIRTRYIYKLNDVKFEIDDYEIPQMKIVAIEGLKDEVDKIYKKIIKIKEV